jgi:hypothetical protein
LPVWSRAGRAGKPCDKEWEANAMLFFGRKKRLIDYASCAG